MDQLETYRKLLYKNLRKYAQLTENNQQINSMVIVSQDRNHFLLINEGWEGKKHIHACLFHGEIRGEKIWIYFDGFEESVTEQLIALGIPKGNIVLAFHPPYVRQKTEFAVQ
ncbi:XisI protein [Crocosphaera sp. XPORK-15E]|uniref:XisI protein n=1 Tax=Crocosphaera sp. XPORK-15E TaxID=3110247 RepID=UPI002B201589|nr:XisI protein [Crocosphaera sp. XPORK-15E]MEA5535777.1 XisI protein [Crocosphaera sp. XPORK-15E]